MSTMNTLIADLEAIPLADMTERDQLTFAAAIGHLRRLSDRVHMLEIGQHRTAEKIDELERENARMREALKPFAAQTRVSSLTEEKMIRAARAALAGSGEK
jgi:hypothetical protein